MNTTSSSVSGSWLRLYAVATATLCLALLGVGGLVTSRGAGMSVPDWPTSYGYNMFALPFSHWIGGALYEHSHRLVATLMGLFTVGLTRWLGGRPARRPMALIGALEFVLGLLLIAFYPGLKGTGHFLMGIAGVVLLAAALPFKNPPASAPLPTLGWIAFAMVQLIGLLGGLRVVLFKDQLGVFHATLAQLFFLLLVTIALLTTRTWARFREARSLGETPMPQLSQGLRKAALALTLLVLVQLIVAASMRHQHAGLAIPDFPLAYGQLWPATDPAAIESYNQRRIETTAQNPIEAFHVHLQMTHRLIAVVLALGIWAWAAAAWRRRALAPVTARLALVWSVLVLLQFILGAFTIWTNKAADVATLHVLGGALTLALGGIICLFCYPESLSPRRREPVPLFVAGEPHPSTP